MKHYYAVKERFHPLHHYDYNIDPCDVVKDSLCIPEEESDAYNEECQKRICALLDKNPGYEIKEINF